MYPKTLKRDSRPANLFPSCFSFFVVVLCFRNLFTYPGKQVEKSDQKGV